MVYSACTLADPEQDRLQALNPWLEDAHEDEGRYGATGSLWITAPVNDVSVGPIFGREEPHRRDAMSTYWGNTKLNWRPTTHRSESMKSTESLRQRLANVNNHFRRMAAVVLGDEDAVRLLAELYQSFNLDIEDLDTCQQGIALAKLTAANFCEVGVKVIYITEAGQSFIEALHKE